MMDVHNKTADVGELLSRTRRPLYAFILAHVRTQDDADDVLPAGGGRDL